MSMRVVVVGTFYSESFASEILKSFQGLRIDAVPFEVAQKPIISTGSLSRVARRLQTAALTLGAPFLQERNGNRLIAAVRARHADLVLLCYDYLVPRHVEALKRAGTTVCMWYPDALANLGRTSFLNAPFDFLFFKDPYIVDVFREKLARPAYYLSEAAWDHDDRSLQDDMACHLTFAGNLYTYRQAFFARLADYDVRIWGNPPPAWMLPGPVQPMIQNRYLTGADLGRAYRSASIVINNLHPAEIWGVNSRAFAVCGHGAFQMIDWRPALSQLFADGEELISFGSHEDLRAKIDYYLPRPEERLRIALAGLERVRRDHTYSTRLTLLLDTVAGRAQGFPMPAVRWEKTPSSKPPLP